MLGSRAAVALVVLPGEGLKNHGILFVNRDVSPGNRAVFVKGAAGALEVVSASG